MRPQILLAAGAERDRPDNDGYTPLAFAIENNHPDVVEFLFHSGAKMSNVMPSIKIPAWMTDIIAKRQNAIASLRVMKGVWRRRFKVPGPASSHIANRVPLDIVNLLGLYVWSTRLDPSWGNEVDSSTAKK
jgi:ankyrin repeat protein